MTQALNDKLMPDTNILEIIEIQGLISQIGEKMSRKIQYDNQGQFNALHEARAALMELEKTLKALRDSFEG